MKNQKLLIAAALAGLTFAGLAVSNASAQDVNEIEAQVAVQDAEAPETTEGDADGERPGRRGGCDLEAAASAIGIEEAALRAALDNGDTIVDVAATNGVDVDVVIDAMVEAKIERINDEVAEGRITQAEADEKLASVEARVTARVNGVEEGPQA